MMEIKLTRKTGFYGMGSPLVLWIDGKKTKSISNNQSITLDVTAPFTMQITFFWLKSPIYTITRPAASYVVKMNLLLLQLYPFLFLASGLSAVYVQQFVYSLVVILVMLVFFFYIKNQAYIIKEE